MTQHKVVHILKFKGQGGSEVPLGMEYGSLVPFTDFMKKNGMSYITKKPIKRYTCKMDWDL